MLNMEEQITRIAGKAWKSNEEALIKSILFTGLVWIFIKK